MHITVAGAGLAGLTAAARLAEAGHEVTVFEERETVGGRVRSTRADGYTFDRGYQVLFTGYPAVQRELDVDALDIGSFVPGATLARDNHRSTLADPLRAPSTLVDSALNRDVRFQDKLNTLRLQRSLARDDYADLLDRDDQTIAEYLREFGFSDAYIERFVAPFYGGITLDRSLQTAANVFQYTYKALSDGKVGLPADGMGAIPEQLAARAREAGARIELGRGVEEVQADDSGATVAVGSETVEADGVVVATDPHAAGELTGVSTPDGAKACVTQHFTFPAHRKLRTGRRIILNMADGRPNTVSPTTDAQPAYTPDDTQLFVANFIGEREESETELAEQVREAMASWYPETRFDEFELRHTDRVEFAQFPQPPGYRGNLPAPDAPDGNAVLAGDYTRWCSIQGSLESGRVAADLAANFA
ncbi:NAD(P)/FAD-dependent oxidoreductase [Halosegnis longus]|uniref:FAD-dependent oxidoreductase n=1 Tax=Halosegnis longus TaxID=2216012 RepID=A0AAJ4UW41_9EURY|nr:NAD(P)/FAD-dependent oxidoreductase [Halosegnis longus]RNJ26678.1 FAD-dependent oxidoreductase [Salella cibi]